MIDNILMVDSESNDVPLDPFSLKLNAVKEIDFLWFDQSEMNLIEGDEGSLYANIDPWDATDQNLVWSSSDESVAMVSTEDGRNAVIKAISAGEATITATSSNGISASCVVRVEKRFVDVWGIYLNQDNLNMTEGDSETLTATIDPADATDQTITWSSSDESLAVVNADGAEATVTALAPGYVEIYASVSNGMTATCHINVEARFIEVTGVSLDQSELNLTEGDTAWLNATVSPDDATDRILTWTSSDESVVRVSENGEVTAAAPGNATVTVTASNGLTASCNVNVEARFIEVTAISLDQSELNLTEGDTAWLNATVSPDDATDRSITWSSSDDSVVRVSENGEVSAVSPGNATVTVTASNGLTASCNLNVEARFIEVTGISLDHSELNLTEGDTAWLNATVFPEDATDRTLTWTSSDESVVRVSENGEVTAVAPGNATVTVTASNGLSASCSVTVTARVIAVTEVVLDNTSLEMTEGDTASLTATVNPADATDKTLTWTSSDSSVASVSENGEIQALKAGTATITVSSANGKTATCVVTVAKKIIEVTSVSFDQTKLDMTEGDTATLMATVNPSDATDKTLTWTSSDASVASVSANGEVKALKAGSATIIVSTANGKTAMCEVTVAARIIEVASVSLDKASLEMTEGDAAMLTATVNPSDATDKTLTWISSDASVASVSANGEVKALKAGTAIITVSSANGKTATCKVTVAAKIIEVTGVVLSNTELKMTEGDLATLTASVQPADATDKTLTWTSSDVTVATVSANGEVKAIKEGTAVIIVKASNGVSATCKVTVESGIIGVTSVSLDKTSLEMTEGDAATLTATVNPSDATDKTLTWTSSDASVASVSVNGEVKALKAGTAIITVSSANGKTATCKVTVAARVIEVSSVSLDKTSLEMTEGEAAMLTATVNPSDATDKTLTWTSSDTSVASVSATGEVKALKAGTTNITVSSVNGKTATCKVTVAAKIIEVTGITLSNTELKMTEGETATLTAIVAPANATDKTLTWTSSNNSVASVSANGEVKALKAGSAIITVNSANGKTANCVVTVAKKIIEVTSVSLDQTKLELTEGDTATLTASVNPADATDKTLTWTSSDSSVATVSANGEVKAIKAGSTTITVSAANSKTATCVVSVAKKIIEVTGLTLSNTELKMTEGDVATLTASVQPADATDKALTWTSSNEAIATVSANGEVKAVKEGNAVITVKASNGVSATCKVTVESGIIVVTSVTLDKTSLEMTEGEAAVLKATVNPADATDKTLTWTSSDSSVATVSATGEVKALKAGTATITVSSANGKTATCKVTVAAKIVEVTGITLSNTELKMTEGDTATLTATVNPSDATDKTLTWTSSDASVASVSINGEVKALNAGTATITVSSTNGNTATCVVTVEPKVIEMQSITLDAEELALEVGDTHQFIATVLPAETTYPELEWWTDDETVATVDQNGFVTMVGEGTTTVHVRSVRWPDIEAVCRLNVTSGVEGIMEEDAPCDIYTTNGKLLKQSVPTSEIRKLDRGLYIIRQRGKTTKLLK